MRFDARSVLLGASPNVAQGQSTQLPDINTLVNNLDVSLVRGDSAAYKLDLLPWELYFSSFHENVSVFCVRGSAISLLNDRNDYEMLVYFFTSSRLFMMQLEFYTSTFPYYSPN